MATSSNSLRTPLGKVRGLGSAKEGAHHFIVQRVTAIALIGLVPWFLVNLLSVARAPFETAQAFVAHPVNAILLLLLAGAAFWHMRLGLQVVVEDYIRKPMTKMALLILIGFVSVAATVAAAFAVLTLAV
jgi:succinate dehydrogenase / fumarate reductase membrane anchor subunit